MKPVLAALMSASLAAVPLAAAAQHHGGGSGGGSGGGHPGGAWSGHTGGGWHGGGGGFRGGHFHGGRPFFGGFGAGLAFGSAWDPWYWDYPGWGSSYTVVEPDRGPDGGYYYDRYNRQYGDAPPPPPGAEAAPPPADAPCDKWQWDAAKSRYFWIACGPAAAPPPK